MSLTVKAYLERPGGSADQPAQEIRRFAIDQDVSSNYEYLSRKVALVFPSLNEPGDFQLFWKDNEGDLVSFSSDEELMEALGYDGMVNDGIFRIYVKVRGSGSSQPDGIFHPNVVCDGCNGPVMGSRFKCTVCPDFDLCGTCEGLGLHPEHELLRLRNPAAPGHPPFYAGMFGPPRPPGCPPGHPPPPGHGPPHHGGPPHYPGQHGFGPGGPGWFMPRRWWRQWARGMFGPNGNGRRRCRDEEAEPETAEEAKQAPTDGEEPQESTNQEAGGDEGNQETGGAAGPREDGGEAPPAFDYLQHVGQAVASMLDPLGIDVDIDVEHQGQRRKCPRRWAEFEGAWGQGQGAEGWGWGCGKGGGKCGKKGMRKAMKMQRKMQKKGKMAGEKKGAEEEEEREVPVTMETQEGQEKQAEKQADQEVMEVAKDDSSSDADGWTHLSPKEGEFTNAETGEGPEATKQKRKEQAVVTAQPPAAGTAGTGGAPVTTQPSPSRPTAPPPAMAAAEFDKQLAEAIAQMEAMGFRDDNGWLSSLLVAKNYDIAQVLDSLYPSGRKPDSLPPYV
ncbi:sequestosome-1-like isoform X2 [Branchiostoma floridae x Branchiostoma belcheri]